MKIVKALTAFTLLRKTSNIKATRYIAKHRRFIVIQ